MDRILRFTTALLLLFFLALTPNQVNAEISTWQKGFTLRLNNQTPEQVDVALLEMKSAGIDYLALSPGWLTSTNTSSNVDRKYGTSSDAIIIYTITKAHSLGMKVLLKPHLDIATGEWRAAINPTNKSDFFENYSEMIMLYANIAESNNVEQFSIGAELVKLTINPDNKVYWVDLINNVRSVYSGELTYSANADDYLPLDEVGKLTFWEELDYMGISFYRPLSDTTEPTVESIKTEWKYFEDEYILPRYNQIQKPLLFTEIGYRSMDGASIRPWDYTITSTVDTQEQKDLYTAFFEYWGNKDYVKGVNFWEWDVGIKIDPLTNKSYTPQLKPAENVVKQYFLGEIVPEIPNPEELPLISNLNRYSTGILKTGALPYSDRSYTINSFPDKLLNQEYIITKNSDKSITNSTDFLIFDIARSAYVYVAYDKRATRIPDWLASFNKTDFIIKSSDTEFYLYQKKYEIGKVSLGANLASPAKGAASHYFVVVSEIQIIPEGSIPEVPPEETTEPENPTSESDITGTITIETPQNNSTVDGEKKLKIFMDGVDLSRYTATYNVDNRGNIDMPNDSTLNYKQAKIDFDTWTWNSNGPYTVIIEAKDLEGKTIDIETLTLKVD